MTRFDDEEARSKAGRQAQLEQALRRSLELDRARLATHRRIVAGDQSLKARRMVSDADALKSRSEADEVESRIAADEARLHEIAYTSVRDETTRRRDRLKRSSPCARPRPGWPCSGPGTSAIPGSSRPTPARSSTS